MSELNCTREECRRLAELLDVVTVARDKAEAERDEARLEAREAVRIARRLMARLESLPPGVLALAGNTLPGKFPPDGTLKGGDPAGAADAITRTAGDTFPNQ